MQDNSGLIDLSNNKNLQSTQNSKDSVEQVEYNLSAFKIGHIADLLKRSDILELSGNVNSAFRNYKCIYRHIKSRLNSEERKKEFRLRYGFLKNRLNITKKEKLIFLGMYYDKYTSFIQDMLKKYGFDMKPKSSKEHLV